MCPMYDSPEIDMSYDIAGYQGVHRLCGTVAEMETSVSELYRGGMRIISGSAIF